VRCVLLLAFAMRLAGQTCNAELERLYQQDQADREDSEKHLGDKKWFATLPERDTARLARAREMARKGELRCPKDYSRAALILQHGSTPDDFLLAHVLSTAAAIGGETDAKWLSAATLDRHLQKIGQPQIFGTQYSFQGKNPWTMDPYHEDLLTDASRELFGVPRLVQQKKQLDEIRREGKESK